MDPQTMQLAISKFKMNTSNLLKLACNGQEFLYDNSIIIECYDTCICITSRDKEAHVHNVYIEYPYIAGVEVIEQKT